MYYSSKEKNQMLVSPGEKRDVWSACVCVFLCLLNSKNNLSLTPFKNQHFFNKYERILYNKMHKDNVHFQNANNPDRKKISASIFHVPSQC